MFNKPIMKGLKMNVALRILSLLGVDNYFRAASMPRPQRESTRPGRNVAIHRTMKEEFTGRGKMARKAHLGTLTIPGGRRGLQVRRVDGKLRITT